MEEFVPFIMQQCHQDLIEVMRSPEYDRHFGVPISFTRLAALSPDLADALLLNPRAQLPQLDSALVKAQQVLLERPWPDRHVLSVKENVHTRLTGLTTFLDSTAGTVSPSISTLGSAHIDKLLTVRGTVVRTGAIKMLESRRLYECTRCRHRFVVHADLESGATVQLPGKCPSTRDKPCPGGTFKYIEEVALYTNYQEIQLQEGARCLTMGTAPRALTILLQDDLADTCQVGDQVEICGVLVRQFGQGAVGYPGMRCHLSLALQATNVAVAKDKRFAVTVTAEAVAAFEAFWEAHRDCPIEGRNKIVAGMCPQLCGLFPVKLASLLMLASGVSGRDDADLESPENPKPDSTNNNSNKPLNGTRGEIHVLLVGDPGTGKSQFMKHVALLSPRAVTVGGRSSSAAGLTAAAVKDGANWSLEAGALVLADGGVCCIDEFDAVREADRAALHEAMEQQTCSVAKAGVVTTLYTRASVFGTCNPRGHKRYDHRKTLAEQLNIGGPLLSRFDLVLLLVDRMDPAEDLAVAEHILGEAAAAPVYNAGPTQFQGNNGRTNGHHHQQQQIDEYRMHNGDGYDGSTASSEGWSLEVLRQYLAWSRTVFRPILSSDAERILSGYYQLRRSAESRHAARTTLRMLESLVRLTQAHARLMARGQATLQDAVAVVGLMEASCAAQGDGVTTAGVGGAVIQGVRVCGDGGHFAEEPDVGYREMEVAVLKAVGFFNEDDNNNGGGGGFDTRYY